MEGGADRVLRYLLQLAGDNGVEQVDETFCMTRLEAITVPPSDLIDTAPGKTPEKHRPPAALN